MRIGAAGFSPYIYNTNYVSAASMDKVAPIDDDLVTSGTDYTSLTDDSLNENPLHKGETSNFMDVLAMQFQMSQLNASRLIKPAEEVAASAAQDSRRDQSVGVQEADMQVDRNLFAMQKAAEAYRVNMIA